MTIHVNIGKAKEQLSRLIAATLRGEEVVIDKDGVPQVRLMPVAGAPKLDQAERRKRIDAILAEMDQIPDKADWKDPLEWDENGLPI